MSLANDEGLRQRLSPQQVRMTGSYSEIEETSDLQGLGLLLAEGSAHTKTRLPRLPMSGLNHRPNIYDMLHCNAP